MAVNGQPRGHGAVGCERLDVLGPGGCLLVVGQRKGADAAVAMAAHAVIVQNCRDFAAIGDAGGRFLCGIRFDATSDDQAPNDPCAGHCDGLPGQNLIEGGGQVAAPGRCGRATPPGIAVIDSPTIDDLPGRPQDDGFRRVRHLDATRETCPGVFQHRIIDLVLPAVLCDLAEALAVVRVNRHQSDAPSGVPARDAVQRGDVAVGDWAFRGNEDENRGVLTCERAEFGSFAVT